MSVTPCLWFNGNAEEAVNFYVSFVPNSRIVSISRYGAASPSDPDKVLMIVFELDGSRYQALNGDASFPFSQAVSLMIGVETQAELDRIRDTIADGGGKPVMCGWMDTDRCNGLPWQVIPAKTGEWLSGDPAAAGRVMKEVMRMVAATSPR